ncbi:hypothetical protein [Chitinophaga tropicalis]|uniref:CHAT domain-containing protein n=1 Tax=Chitinophaga tropicalis TaxID=2683588 RepID=A0A7K1U061_9BACT|nr:hypothetical protein [Chitinophaga tropicalis]MVT07748.1 hypothetical protein [Chitinophaga tropicalis]
MRPDQLYYLILAGSPIDFTAQLLQPVQVRRMPCLNSEFAKLKDKLTCYNQLSEKLIEIFDINEQLAMPQACIIADTHSKAGMLARHYAAFLGRPFIDYSLVTTGRVDFTMVKNVRSATVFVPRLIKNTTLWKNAFENAVERQLRRKLSFGYIPPMPIEAVCNYLIKIIVHFITATEEGKITDFSMAVDHLTPLRQSGNLIASLKESYGQILVLAHSKSNCAVLQCKEQTVALCGSPTKGENGKCFAGTNCSYKDKPKVTIADLNTELLFLNGCTSASVSPSTNGIPYNYTLAYAALSGTVLGYIGNTLVTRAYESDLDWMRTFLQMKMKPARIVKLIDQLRKIENREHENVSMFIGDAEYTASDTNHSITFMHEPYAEVMNLEWNDTNQFLCVMVQGKTLAHLFAKGFISITVPPTPTNMPILYGNILYNHFSQYSTILFKKAGTKFLSEKVTMRIATEKSQGASITCRQLEFLYHELSAYQTVQPYRRIFEILNLKEIQQQIIKFNRIEHNTVNKPWQNVWKSMRDYNENLFKKVNGFLIKEALRNASQGWKFDHEYGALFYTPRHNGQYHSSCKICGSPSSVFIHRALANSFVERESEVCSVCGVIRDMPSMKLECSFYRHRPLCNETSYQDWVYFKNNSDEDMLITYSLSIIFRDVPPQEPTTRLLKRQSSLKEKCTFPYDTKPSGLFYPKLYVACNGGFGFISRTVLFAAT